MFLCTLTEYDCTERQLGMKSLCSINEKSMQQAKLKRLFASEPP